MTPAFQATLLISCLLAAAVGALIGYKFQCGRVKRKYLAQLLTSTMERHIILKGLREGEQHAAIEAIEFAIDCAIPTIWRSLSEPATSNKDFARSVLTALREYREKWPRAISVDEAASLARARTAAATAAGILNSFQDSQ